MALTITHNIYNGKKAAILNKRRNWQTIIALIIISIAGVFFTWITINQADQQMRKDLLLPGWLVTHALDVNQVKALTGAEADLNLPEYQQLKQQLAQIRQSSEEFLSVYLTGLKPDGTVFFQLDSEVIDSKDYSPPGKIYSEASADFRHVFDTGLSAVEGPVSNNRGTWVSVLVPLIDANGKLISVLGMDIDASAWQWNIISRAALPVSLILILLVMLSFSVINRRVKGELMEKEEFLSTIIENIPHMIFIKDAAELKFIRFNRAGEELLGKKREELIGKNDYDFFPKEQADYFTKIDREVLSSGRLHDISEELIDAKSGRRILHTKKIPVLNKNGELAYLLGISEDITDRKQAEDRLKESEEKFRATIEQSSDGIIIFDKAARIIEWSSAQTSIFGYTRAEMLDKSIWELQYLMSPLEQKTAALLKQARTVKPTRDNLANLPWLNKVEEFSIQRPDGSRRSVQITAFPVVVSDTKFYGAITRDITNLKQAEVTISQLRELDKLKDEFLNIAAHELKTPLTSIIGLSEIIKGQEKNLPSAIAKFPEIIYNEGLRLGHVVKRILTVTRFESGKESVHTTPIELVSYIKSLLTELSVLGRKKNVNFATSFFEDNLLIESDKEKISEVIINFVDNAIKYGPEKQTITLSAYRLITGADQGMVRIEVADQGAGISADSINKLFNKFSQLEPSLSRSQEGTGLGLYICKLIVDKLGGRIGVESESGKGSKFFFLLPAKRQ